MYVCKYIYRNLEYCKKAVITLWKNHIISHLLPLTENEGCWFHASAAPAAVQLLMEVGSWADDGTFTTIFHKFEFQSTFSQEYLSRPMKYFAYATLPMPKKCQQNTPLRKRQSRETHPSTWQIQKHFTSLPERIAK